MNTPNLTLTLIGAVPVVTVPVRDDEATKAVVRHELGSLDDFDLPAPVLTRCQARAERALHAAIRTEYDDGVTVPCLTDPATWDADQNPTDFQITTAARLCRTACPVFDRCAAFVATEPPVCGIVAGRFIPHPIDMVEHRAASHARKDQVAARAA
ncbi:hypothetical protein F1D05_33420 [Kribbella qitaiheensis]|uniref:4Fe-4S Wbl-type domain-containing protein n=1 Tax=Kribbella qitaiheensis TaxID=1544730 RepID=A0A7G6X6Q7_9ACTN|nr:hypothetical protein [Kribbella qitaiheensis]QNE21922.1 hypothetical protein F1D05_33420 [Kribbella qitaiheensis]